MFLAGLKRWLDGRLGPSKLGLSEGDYQRPKGKFGVKQLVGIYLAPGYSTLTNCRRLVLDWVTTFAVIPTAAEIQISLICLSLKKVHEKTATIEAEAPTMTVGQR